MISRFIPGACRAAFLGLLCSASVLAQEQLHGIVSQLLLR
jgi:hypothetical protein